jgi:hypothetical protein
MQVIEELTQEREQGLWEGGGGEANTGGKTQDPSVSGAGPPGSGGVSESHQPSHTEPVFSYNTTAL